MLTQLSGSVNDEQLRVAVEELPRVAQGMPHFAELSDCRGLEDVSGITGPGVRESARLESLRPAWMRGRLAILYKSELIFGLARMYGSICEPYRESVRLFGDMDEALDWLGLADEHESIERALGSLSRAVEPGPPMTPGPAGPASPLGPSGPQAQLFPRR